MIQKIKEIEVFKLVLPLFVMVAMSLCGVLYAQQNKKIDQKVDNAVMQQTIKVIETKQEVQREQIEDQRKVDAKTLEVLQNLNIQIMLLNEKLKTEAD